MKKIFAIAAISCFFANALFGEIIKVDPKISEYKKVSGVGGNLNSVGSDTLNNLMTLWSEEFSRLYPGVNVQIEGKGSGTAPPALISGVAQLAPMSREMKNEEIEKFEDKFGFKPLKIAVALDALSVFVNKDNPLNEITMKQIDAAFSSNRKAGLKKSIDVWGQLGLSGSWKNQPISLFGRNSASGTYGFFKKKALKKGDFKNTVKEQPGSASVVLGVTENRNAIGYSGVGYITSGVKELAISKGKKAYAPSYKNVLSGNYPLGRLLYVYVAKKPNRKIDRLTAEFLKLILSKKGQEIVIKDGYLPLPPNLVNANLKNL